MYVFIFQLFYYRMPISYFETDPITQHNIQLVQYTKQMQELLQQMQQSYKVTRVQQCALGCQGLIWIFCLQENKCREYPSSSFKACKTTHSAKSIHEFDKKRSAAGATQINVSSLCSWRIWQYNRISSICTIWCSRRDAHEVLQLVESEYRAGAFRPVYRICSKSGIKFVKFENTFYFCN